MTARRDVYGFWGSTLWTLGAFFVAALVTFIALTVHGLATRPAPPAELRALPQEYLVTLSSVVIVAVLIGAARTTRWPLIDYFAVLRPSNLYVVIAIIGAVGIGFAEHGLLSLLGDTDASARAALSGYRLAQGHGLLPLYWFNTVMLAPLTEELIFRGFLLPSWAKSRLGRGGAMLATSVLFALMHIQYDWRGMIAIGLLGVFYAWLRLRSGSLIPPLIAHGGGNLLAMIGLALSLAWLR
jgi:hypothetical protein